MRDVRRDGCIRVKGKNTAGLNVEKNTEDRNRVKDAGEEEGDKKDGREGRKQKVKRRNETQPVLELRAGEGREATNKQDATHTRPVYFQLKLRQEQTHFQQTHKTAGQLWAAYETRAFISMG